MLIVLPAAALNVDFGTILGFAAPTVAVVVSWLFTRGKLQDNRTRLEEIHVLVNSQMTDALREIDELRGIVNELKRERRLLRDELRPFLVDKLPPKNRRDE